MKRKKIFVFIYYAKKYVIFRNSDLGLQCAYKDKKCVKCENTFRDFFVLSFGLGFNKQILFSP